MVTAAVKALAAQGQGALAATLALAHWLHVPRALRFVAKPLAAALAEYPAAKLRILGFSTTDTLKDELTPAFAALGWRAEASQGNFGEVIPELLRPAGDADACLLFLDPLSLHTRDWRSASEDATALLEDKLAGLASAVEHFLRERQQPLFITTLPAPAAPASGLIDNRHPGGALRTVETINRALAELAARQPQVILIDADHALADIAPVAPQRPEAVVLRPSRLHRRRHARPGRRRRPRLGPAETRPGQGARARLRQHAVGRHFRRGRRGGSALRRRSAGQRLQGRSRRNVCG